jgi:two-component system response regulator YesN
MTARYKVVVADDNDIVLRAMRQCVDWESLSCEIVGAELNGIAAEKAIREKRPDIVVTDIKMPGRDGLQLIESVREYDRDVVFIIISSFGTFEYAQKAIRFHVFEFITKPISYPVLEETLRRARDSVERRRSERARFQLAQSREGAVDLAKKSLIYELLITGDRTNLEANDDLLKELRLSSRPYELLLFCSLGDGDDAYQSIQNWFQKEKAANPMLFDGVCLKIGGDCFLAVFYRSAMKERAGTQEADSIVRSAESFIETEMPKKLFLLRDRMHFNAASMKKAGDDLTYFKENYLLDDSQRASLAIQEEIKKADLSPYDFSELARWKAGILGEPRAAAVRKFQDYAEALAQRNISAPAIRTVLWELFVHIDTQAGKGFRPDDERTSLARARIASIRTRSQLRDCVDFLAGALMAGEASAEPINPAADRIVDYIRRSCGKPLALGDVAQAFKLSSSHTSALIKKATGKSYSALLTESRIALAKKLLKDPLVNVGEAGRLSGFSDYPYFYQVFRRQVGMSPNEFRRKAGD